MSEIIDLHKQLSDEFADLRERVREINELVVQLQEQGILTKIEAESLLLK